LQLYWNIFDAIDRALDEVFADVANLQTTFDPPPPNDEFAQVVLTLLQQAWTIFAAPNLTKSQSSILPTPLHHSIVADEIGLVQCLQVLYQKTTPW
jgi:hypothetical protein